FSGEGEGRGTGTGPDPTRCVDQPARHAGGVRRRAMVNRKRTSPRIAELGPAVGVLSAGPLPVGSLRWPKSDRLLPSKALRNPKASKKDKALAGSALAQARAAKPQPRAARD